MMNLSVMECFFKYFIVVDVVQAEGYDENSVGCEGFVLTDS